MPIYKDNQRNTYYVSLSYIDKFGERKYHKKRGFRRRKDARKYEDDFYISLDEGVIKDALPFTHLSNDYLEWRSEEHTSELQSRFDLVCRLLLEKKKKQQLS